jgi:hypothetical protein
MTHRKQWKRHCMRFKVQSETDVLQPIEGKGNTSSSHIPKLLAGKSAQQLQQYHITIILSINALIQCQKRSKETRESHLCDLFAAIRLHSCKQVCKRQSLCFAEVQKLAIRTETVCREVSPAISKTPGPLNAPDGLQALIGDVLQSPAPSAT